MNVGWLLDGEMFERYRDELVAAIRAAGDEVRLVHPPRPPFRWEDAGCAYREAFPPGACVVAHADLDLARRVRRETTWAPGAFFTEANFFWSAYSPWYEQYLLNRDCLLLPFGELQPQRDSLFARFGRDERIFVRPDSPLKIFTGQLAGLRTWDADLELMAFYDVPSTAIVVVSSPKAIAAEWRFVIARGEVVAGSQYRRPGALEIRAEYDAAARELAAEIAALDYEPDPAWVLDVCRTDDGSYHLLEIGAFSAADLYACDKPSVVAAVSAAAREIWQTAQGQA